MPLPGSFITLPDGHKIDGDDEVASTAARTYYEANKSSLDALAVEREAKAPPPLPAITAALASREQVAAGAITQLKASVAWQLMQAGLNQEATNAAGSALIVQFAPQIQAYILAGGNAVAGQALLSAVEADPPAWWSDPIAAIFAATLA